MDDSGAMRPATVETEGLQRLIEVLAQRGYRVVGPTLRDNAIVLAELDSADDLPRGRGVDTAPGLYRVRPRDDSAAFGHSSGPQSYMASLVTANLDATDEELASMCERLIRTYDPCISRSAHFLTLAVRRM